MAAIVLNDEDAYEKAGSQRRQRDGKPVRIIGQDIHQGGDREEAAERRGDLSRAHARLRLGVFRVRNPQGVRRRVIGGAGSAAARLAVWIDARHLTSLRCPAPLGERGQTPAYQWVTGACAGVGREFPIK